MFSNCKESAEKSLANHLLKDGSRLEEGIDVHRLDFRLGSMFVQGCLGLFWALIHLSRLHGNAGPKSFTYFSLFLFYSQRGTKKCQAAS